MADLADREVAPHAEAVDKDRRYPTESLNTLQRKGLWGLRVSKEHGGLGADLVTTCLVVEEIAKRCPSTAMCYKMHLEAAEVICRIPTDYQIQQIIEPMARGEVLATVAGSESWGNGDNWTSSRSFSAVRPVAGGYHLDGIRKSYVTSAGEATHHFFICRIGEDAEPGQLSLLFVERDQIDWELLEPWDGLGLRGNGSSPMRFSGFVPQDHRIGQEHTAMRDVSQLFPPVMGLTHAAAYLGVGSGAYEIACQEGNRRFASGSRRLDAPINQRRMAKLSARIEAAQTMLHAEIVIPQAVRGQPVDVWRFDESAERLSELGDSADASQVFEGPTLTFEDDRFAYDEQRFITLGLLPGQVVVIAHTERDDEVRVISMRKGTKREQTLYFHNLTN